MACVSAQSSLAIDPAWATRAVVLHGSTAMGSGRADGRPDGRFQDFVAPTISASGLIAFEGAAAFSPPISGKPGSRGGIWLSDSASGALRLVMLSGILAPGTGGTFSEGFSEVRVDSLGNVLFDASGLSGPAALGLFHADPAGRLGLVLLQGQSAPGAPQLRFGDVRNGSGFANNGHFVANEPLVTDRLAAAGAGAFAWDGSALTNVLVRGQPVPGAAAGVTFNGGVVLAINGTGDSLLSAQTLIGSTGTLGLWRIQNGGFLPIFEERQPMPGAGSFDPRFSLFESASLNVSGRLAVLTSGINNRNESIRAVYGESANGFVQLVTRNGHAAPNPVNPTFTFLSFSDVLINGLGHVAFHGVVGGVPNGDGYWIARPGAILPDDTLSGHILQNVVIEGMRAVDPTLGPDATFASLPAAFAFNRLDQLAFTAKLAGTGIGAGNDDSLWIHDPARGLHLLAREGTPFLVADGDIRTVRQLQVIGTSSNAQDGRPTALSDAGLLAFGLRFTNTIAGKLLATGGIFVAGPPTCMVTNTLDEGPGSLRAAIECANLQGNSRIQFGIPSNDPGFDGRAFRIEPTSPLPAITNVGIVLDGQSQTAFTGDSNPLGPEVHLHGGGKSAYGLVLLSSDGVVAGIVVNGFGRGQVLLAGRGATRNLITQSFIGGLGPGGGSVPFGPGGDTVGSNCGIVISNAPNNRVGSGEPGGGNLLTFSCTNLLIVGSEATGNRVEGNLIGLDRSGSLLVSPMDPPVVGICDPVGIVIQDAPGNIIGGTNAASRNVIAQGVAPEIVIQGIGASNNVVRGNYVGLDASGLKTPISGAAGTDGCNISIEGAPQTMIGGSEAGAGNVVGGPVDCLCITEAAGTRVLGNLIGVDRTGTNVLASSRGIRVASASDTTIGGGALAERNIISGARGSGIYLESSSGIRIRGNLIGTDISGGRALGNGQGIFLTFSSRIEIGGPVPGQGNVISGNLRTGLELDRSDLNVISGNLIGTDSSGTRAMSNNVGIAISRSDANLVGGRGPSDGNVISGNASHGLTVDEGSQSVEGNRIGLDRPGGAALPNGGEGILISGGAHLIGGLHPSSGNSISGNGRNGIAIEGEKASGQFVFGNRIGTDARGVFAIPNRSAGILIHDAAENEIGGPGLTAINVISGNGQSGVELSGPLARFNILQNNLIGTDLTGLKPVGNGDSGITLRNAPRNVLFDNLISDNRGDGIRVVGDSSLDNLIEANQIGIDRFPGGRLGNALDGIHLDGASDTVISNNIVAFNGRTGVGVASGSGNRIRANRISGNGGPGIDLNADGITPNDPADPDGGGNQGQNTPTLISGEWAATGAILRGMVEGRPNVHLTVELFASGACDPSGFGEGDGFLESFSASTDPTGRSGFTHRMSVPIAQGTVLTATATDPSGNTSEFSECLVIGTPGALVDLAVTQVAVPSPAFAGSGLRYEIVVTNLGPARATGIVLTNLVPVGCQFVEALPVPGGGCSLSERTLRCHLPDLPRGGSQVLLLWVVPAAAGSLTNTVFVTATEADADPTDNLHVLRTDTLLDDAPQLLPTRVPAGLSLSWANAAGDRVLESSLELGPSAKWSGVTDGVASEGGRSTALIPSSPRNRFFRLRQIWVR